MNENDEARMPNAERRSKHEGSRAARLLIQFSNFGTVSSFVIRASSLRRHFSQILLLTLLALAAPACRRDMFIQPSSKPLEHSDFFQDNHMASRPILAHTIARG